MFKFLVVGGGWGGGEWENKTIIIHPVGILERRPQPYKQ